ncbi:uncharacterized protein LOC107427580 [Ziziphus jujuba]|uniref:Uncharacterized protein LOC107427580 n=1 Tax=Ziziphus jujuba TaxID=326968 RepID=A0A6P4B4T9_ZIZJJ|nr:uncharacterized protein LOC107427580 [Ziziphus jujuba]XP_015893452.3 uncharacterized protein LOC107427580 [Ziziphus jujuba]
MADSGAKVKEKRTKKTNKKRKQKINEETERSSKTQRISFSEEGSEPQEMEEEEQAQKSGQRELNQNLDEEGCPWRNLQLILSLQDKDLDLQKKVELAFHFVTSRRKEGNDATRDCETVKMSRLIIFLNDWIQSLLVSSEKKIRVGEEKPHDNTYLDFRCWKIFKFCLEESLNLHVSLSYSRNLLRSISSIAKNALSELDNKSSCPEELYFVGERFELYSTVLDCMSLVFSSHGGLSNENLDLWVSTMNPVLELAHKISAENLYGGNAGVYVLQFSCLIFEPFAKFLRAHPTRKTGFQDFVDKLLEPLLHLLGILHIKTDGCNPTWTRNLLKLVEDVLSDGLFHPVHIDGFLSLHSTEKYVVSHDGEFRDSKTVIKSYHRHLFDKLERITAAKKELAAYSIGELFHLFVDRVKKPKGALGMSRNANTMAKSEGSKQLEDNWLGHTSKMFSESSNVPPDNSYCLNSLSAERRKALFDFFVVIMEPLLCEIHGYLQADLEFGPVLSDVHCTLKSITNLLASFMHGKVYMRTEDNTEGACLNFLKKVYDMIISMSSRLIKSSKYYVNNRKERDILTLLANEILDTIGFLLEIEYEVIENDLVSLWLMMFSYLAIGLTSTDGLNNCSLSSKITNLGCQLFNLYSQLRQVNNTIFTLCKAIRLSHGGSGETDYARFLTSLHGEVYAKSVGMLLCSHEFKIAIHRAVKSIPEGQASGCLRQLTRDMSEALEWMKESCSLIDEKEFGEQVLQSRLLGFSPEAELLGRGLSELYVLVLGSLTVTAGNSNLVGVSIKDLVTLLCPYMSTLVGAQPDAVNEFLFSVTGKTFDNDLGNRTDLQSFVFSTHWVFVFFFQLYMSCRILYRQAASLVPPDSSRKMSAAMGESFTAYSGRDWMQSTDWTDDSYFSWFSQTSASLLDIIQLLSNIYLQKSAADCSPLIYTMHAMSLQRLVDLNRKIKSFEYLLQSYDNLLQSGLLDDASLSRYNKRSKKLRSIISVLRQEAVDLTAFMMGHLSLVKETSDDLTCEEASALKSDEWDLGVSAVNNKSLPAAIWWIVCQNIDVWCTHADRKKLKMFLSLLIHTSLPYGKSSFREVGKWNLHEHSQLKQVTVHQISTELFDDSILYEKRFVRKHFVPRFCRVLEKSALLLIGNFGGNVDFKSSPNWSEVLSALENPSVVVSSNQHVNCDCFSAIKTTTGSSDKLLTQSCKEPKSLPFPSMKFTACQSLLSLLSWMPKGYFGSRSFSLLVTCILNLERCVIGCILDCQNKLCSHDYYELCRLFVSCRKALKCIIVTSCERPETCDTSLTSVFFDDSLPALWLFKSLYAVVGIQELLPKDDYCKVDDMIFTLMDQTLYVLLTLNKYHFSYAPHFFKYALNHCKEQDNAKPVHEEENLMETDPLFDSSDYIEARKSASLVPKSLREQMEIFLITLKNALGSNKVSYATSVLDLNKFSSIVSCFSGVLWGVVSVVKQTDTRDGDIKIQSEHEPVSEINLCINVFAEFSSLLIYVLLFEDDKLCRSLSDARKLQKSSCYISWGKQLCSTGEAITCISSSDANNDSRVSNVAWKWPPLKDANTGGSFQAEDDPFELESLNKTLLKSLLKGDNPETAFLLRQLLIASSAIWRLHMHINSAPLSSGLMQIYIGISQVLLSEFVNMNQVPQPFCFVWLDGILKFLEELGSHFPSTNPMLSRNLYVKMVELQLGAIGKCITVQGKRATLASHEAEASTKMLQGHVGLSDASLNCLPYCLDEFKARLRLSFSVFIKKPSEFYLLSAIQAIERALVGVREIYTMIYDVYIGSADGGKVSSTVAAGIDCLDLLLEFASGRKRLSVVKRHIQSLLASVFNIILHLQSPLIFYERCSEGNTDPDPGAVILMGVEVLTRISGKHALFQMEAWHVAQALRIPATLFQDFHQLKLSKASVLCDTSMISSDSVSDPAASMQLNDVDRKFSLDLFAACCRLLYTVMKHHKSVCEQCIALLEASVLVLLHSLETMDADSVVRTGYFSWKVEEGVKCAYCLRRIYEEVRHSKDVFGQHGSQILSSYIWVYSGFGPLKTGIKREIDEALRPGVYALLDVCSADDLQYLHTVFGEGPCRNTLATLQHDYKLHFQYEGKV